MALTVLKGRSPIILTTGRCIMDKIGGHKMFSSAFQNSTQNYTASNPSICKGTEMCLSNTLHRISTSSVPFMKESSRVCQTLTNTKTGSDIVQERDNVPSSQDEDMPISGMVNPYEKPAKKCVLCEHDVDLDYKNVRLLSQFVSPHTGRLYGRHITGLCIYMQRRISSLVKISRASGYMPYMNKDPKFLRDPKLYDQFRRKN